MILSFDEAIDPASVTAASVRITLNGVELAATRVVSADGRVISIRAPLWGGQSYGVAVSGLRTTDGRTIPDGSATFVTGMEPVSPFQDNYALNSYREDLPPDLPVRVTFDKPLDPATVGPGTFYLENSISGQMMPLDCAVSKDLRTIVCPTASPLAVGTRFHVRQQGVRSVYGQRLADTPATFSTGFEPDDRKAPRLIRITPTDGATGVSPYQRITLVFDERVQENGEAPQVTVTENGVPIEVYVDRESSDLTRLRVSKQLGTWEENATYVVRVDQAYDVSGRGLVNPGVSATFSTGAFIDPSPTPGVSIRPYSGNLPLNVVFFADLNIPAVSQSVTAETVRLTGPGGVAVPLTVTFDNPTRLRIQPQVLLSPNTQYEVAVGPGVLDALGREFQEQRTVTIGDAADETAPQILGVSPPDGAQDVPAPHKIRVEFSEQIVAPDRGFRLERDDGEVITWRMDGFGGVNAILDWALDPGRQYRIIADGVMDLAGNPLPPFQSTFTTAPAGTANDQTRPTILSSTPANQAVDVPLDPTITLEMSEPLDPTSIQFVTLSTSIAEPIDVTLLNGGRTIRIIPQQALKPGRKYFVAVNAMDWAGNRCLQGCRVEFTTVAGASDTTPPQILSITPAEGSLLELGPNESVNFDIVFSEPVESATLFPNLFVAVNGSRVNAGPVLMNDGATAKVGVALSNVVGDAEVALILDADIADLYGNLLGAERRHEVTARVLAEDEPADRHQLLDIRPTGQGGAVSPNAIVTLISGAPVASEGIEETLVVSENGVIKAGTIQLRADDQIVEFVPLTPFQPGALVQIFLRGPLNSRDQDYPIGRQNFPENLYFYVEGAGMPFRILAVTPPDDSRDRPVAIRPSLLFNAPVDPATVSSATVRLVNSLGPVVPGTLQVLGDGEIVEFRPAQNLDADQRYVLQVDGVLSQTGEPLAAAASFVFTTSANVTATPLQVTAVSPSPGSVEASLNSLIRIGLSAETIRRVRPEDLRLESAGRVWEIDSVGADFSGRMLSFKPLEALQPNTLYTATFAGAVGATGSSTGPTTWSFRTADTVEADGPSLLPYYNQRFDLTPNSQIKLTYDGPVDLVDFTGAVLKRGQFDDLWSGDWTVSPDGRTAIFTPHQPLPVGSTFTIQPLQGGSGYGFSTGLTPDTTPPTVQSSSILPNAKNVSPFDRLALTMSEGIDPRTVTPANLRLFDGDTPLPVEVSLSNRPGDSSDSAWELITAGCTCVLELGRTYRAEMSGVRDLAGNAVAPYSLTFTTRPVYEFQPPTFTLNLRFRTDVFRTVTAKVRSSEPLNRNTVNAQTVYYEVDGTPWPSLTALDPDGLIIRVSPLQTLPANKNVRVVMTTNVQDLAGNSPQFDYALDFSTGEAEFDVQPPMVSLVNPPDGSTGVPVNVIPFVSFSEPLDPFSTYPSYRLFGPGGVPVSTADGLLLPNTTYTIDVPPTGTDFADLPFAGAQFTFTTGASAVPDTTLPTLLSSTPAADAVDVPVNTSIELLFSEPVQVTFASVYPANGYSGQAVPAQLVQGADPTRATIQLLELLAPNVDYRVQFSGRDLASQSFGGYFDFRASATSPDMTGPRVLTINPPDGSTDVAMADVVLQFDEPLDPLTVSNGSIRMFADGEPLSPSVSYAGYGPTVHLQTHSAWPNSWITVTVASTLLDRVGNPAEPFVSRFRIAPRVESPDPMISVVRPATGQMGVPVDAAVHLFLTDPIDPASAQAAVLASENGALVSGTVNVTANNRALTFTPDRPWAEGSEVRLFVDLRLLQLESGGQFSTYLWETWFQAGPRPFDLIANPHNQIRPRNTHYVLRFTRPVDPSTVTPSNFSLAAGQGLVDQPVNLTIEQGGLQVRMVPQQQLAANQGYFVNVGGGVRAASGETIPSPASLYFEVNDTVQTVAPTARISPADGLIGVGVNGSILVSFDGAAATSTVNETTLSWTDGVSVYRPWAPQYVMSGAFPVLITPHVLLKPLTTYTVTLDGAEDFAGNPVPMQVASFTTGDGPDLTAPRVVRFSPTDDPAARNSAPSIEFSEPVDPETVLLRSQHLGQVATEFTKLVSDGGRTITFLPNALLEPNSYFWADMYHVVRDISGNPLTESPSNVGWRIGEDIIAPPLGVKLALPANGATGVSIDSRVVIQFDREIRATTLDPARIRIEQGGVPIPIRIELLDQGKALELIPTGLLDPFTSYTWIAEGVVDLAGNGPVSIPTGGFSTGASAAGAGPALVSATPAEGAVGVGLTASWVLVFDQPVNPLRSYFNLSPSSSTEARWSGSADGKTWTITRDEPWPAQSEIVVSAYLAGLSGLQRSYQVKAATGN